MKKFEERFGRFKMSLQVLKDATDDFDVKYLIGGGGFGRVYRASIPIFNQDAVPLLGHSTQRLPVAIKRGAIKFGQGKSSFQTEVGLLSHFDHTNIVSLIGYCDEENEMIIVYKFASNGSLDRYLQADYSNSHISWARRLKICIGIVRGLDYLHHGSKRKVTTVHRDIKSSNVLLDQNWNPMISDFGLSVFARENEQFSSLKESVGGTPVYIDPHYLKTKELSEMVDVYPFGVLLYEVLSCKLAYSSKILPSPTQLMVQLPDYESVHPELSIHLKKVLSKRDLYTEANFSYLIAFSLIANKCLQPDPDKRPQMTDILVELEKLLKFQITASNLRVSLEEIEKATNNFDHSNIIGWGKSSRVYKGVLSRSHGDKRVAVKRFKRGVEEEVNFLTDILILNDYNHPNVIGLLGFHYHENKKMVIYEYAFNGSLDKYLSIGSNKYCLTWKQILKICRGAAQGLKFIHTSESQVGVVHGDVKSSNILLTHDWDAKISNFGLSKRTHKNGSKFLISSGAGTLGYCDPAYIKTGVLTKASDVYSFGVVLFEVLGKSILLKNDRHNGDPRVDEWRKLNKIDVNKYQDFSQSFSTFLDIARQCVQEKPEKRPTMGKVVDELIVASHFETSERECVTVCP